MHFRLHANTTTTPRTRACIRKSTASNATLARELGIHPRTVARWTARGGVADRSIRPPDPALGGGPAFQTDTPAGFIHIDDVKSLPPLGRRRSYAYSLPQRRLGSPSIAPPALSISRWDRGSNGGNGGCR